jgi:hypothetical protein
VLFDAGPQPLRQSNGFRCPGPHEQDDELLTSVAGNDVVLTSIGLEEPRQDAEHIVAGGMPEGVVVALEMVQIEHRNRQPKAVAAPEGEVSPKFFIEVVAILEPGEMVGRHEFREPGIERGQVLVLLLQVSIPLPDEREFLLERPDSTGEM